MESGRSLANAEFGGLVIGANVRFEHDVHQRRDVRVVAGRTSADRMNSDGNSCSRGALRMTAARFTSTQRACDHGRPTRWEEVQSANGSSNGRQPAGQIGPQIRGIFQADRQSHQAVADAVFSPLGGGHEFV